MQDDERSVGATRSDLVTLVGVGLGGAAGASARWLVGEAVTSAPATDGGIPWATLLVNVVGCLLVGLAAARLHGSGRAHDVVVTGVLGGFTTMSALAIELNDLADADHLLTAATYLTVTLVGGLVALVIGSAIGARTQDPPVEQPT